MSVEAGAVLVKDPDAILVYEFDWARWLGGAARIGISTFRVTGPDAVLVNDAPMVTPEGTIATVRLTGGTVGADYLVANQITTNETPPQTEETAVTIRIKQKVA